VLGGAADLPTLRGDRGIDAVVVAIGDNGTRSTVAARLRILVPNLAFATVIDPTAVVARAATIGAGTVIMAGAVVGTGATVVADVTDHVVAYGTPCRVIRPRHAGERYL
jgi:acetyltransferase-like isoleucine patch superfamily enzyme